MVLADIRAEVGEMCEMNPRRPQMLVCTLSDADLWEDHEPEALRCLELLRNVIATAKAREVEIEIDLGVMREDFWDRWITELRFGMAWFQLLHSLEIGFMVSIYGNGPKE